MFPSVVKIQLLLLFHTLFSVAEPLETYNDGYNERPGLMRYERYTPRLGKRVQRIEEVENKIQREALFSPRQMAEPLETYDVGLKKQERYTPRLGKRVQRIEEGENKIQREALFPRSRNFLPLTCGNPGNVQLFQLEK